MIKKILTPVDGSKHSLKAAQYAMEIASKMGAKVDLLHVLPSSASLYQSFFGLVTPKAAMERELSEKLEKDWKKIGQEILDKTLEQTHIAGVNASVKLVHGNVVESIIGVTKSGQYDMIIMGNKGTGGISEALLGGVSIQISRHAPCPVLIVR
jgi:nucleotide-binding universal stress UspA family protein